MFDNRYYELPKNYDKCNFNTCNEYRKLLEKVHNGVNKVDENTVQRFLEKHSALIPTPFY